MAVRYPVDKHTPIRIPKIELNTMKVIVFSNALFAKNSYLPTQLGHFEFIIDANYNATPIVLKSCKAQKLSGQLWRAIL